jgi:DNA-binding MarR family transcriptional regulator
MIQVMNCLISVSMPEIPRGFAERPALLLVKLGNEVAGRAQDPLAGLGLSGRQYMALAVLSSDEPSSQLELARLCGLLPAQVVPVVDELQRRGLVERQRDEADRRRSVVRATPRGLELLAQADALARSIEDELFGGLDGAAREQFAGALRAALARAQRDD